MSYVGYEQTPSARGGQIRLDAISEAWALVRQQMGVWVLAMLLYFVILFAISAIVSALSGGLTPTTPPSNPGPAYVISQLGRSSGNNIVSTVLGAFFSAGIFRMALKQLRGEQIGVGDLFSGGDAILAMIGANLLTGLITLAVALIAIVPMAFMIAAQNSFAWIPAIFIIIAVLFINARLFLVAPIVADGRGGALGSIKQSFEATGGQTLNAFLFMLVLGLVVMLGVLACGVGLLFSFPIAPLAIAIVYQDLFGLGGSMPEPRLNIPLPPSSAYGSGAPGLPGQPPAYGQTPSDMQGRGNAMPMPPLPPGKDSPPPAPGQMDQIQM